MDSRCECRYGELHDFLITYTKCILFDPLLVYGCFSSSKSEVDFTFRFCIALTRNTSNSPCLCSDCKFTVWAQAAAIWVQAQGFEWKHYKIQNVKSIGPALKLKGRALEWREEKNPPYWLMCAWLVPRDTAGQERYQTITKQYYRRAQVIPPSMYSKQSLDSGLLPSLNLPLWILVQGIIFVYDITNQAAFQHIAKWASDVDEVRQ